MFKGAEWDEMCKLLPANLIEHREIGRLNNTYPNYRDVTAHVLLLAGGKSPEFREQTLCTLSDVLPNSEKQIMNGLDHFGPTSGRAADVAQVLKAYFLK
jgi:hypothetical protein